MLYVTAFRGSTRQPAVSCVTMASLWLAAPLGVEPHRATLSGKLQTPFCFGSWRLFPWPPVHSLQGISLNTLYLCASWRTQAFLMPAYSDNSIGFGRVRTEVLFNFRYVVYVHCCCGLAPRRMNVMGHSFLMEAMKMRPSVTAISVHLHF